MPYSPLPLPDFVLDPTVRKTVDEWMEIFYPGEKPWWTFLMKALAWWKYGNWRKHFAAD